MRNITAAAILVLNTGLAFGATAEVSPIKDEANKADVKVQEIKKDTQEVKKDVQNIDKDNQNLKKDSQEVSKDLHEIKK